MAQFTAQGRLKLLLNSDGVPCKLVGSGFVNGLRSFRVQKGKLRFVGSSTRLYAFNLSKKAQHFPAESSLDVINDEDEDYDSEFEEDELAYFRGLVLDLSYRPVNVVCWKRAICLEFMEKAAVLEYYDQTINSPSGSFYIPAVLKVPHLLQVVKKITKRSKLSRKNILHRDNYTCQYCSSQENLTVDHVLPASLGGQWKWENLVAACSKCNSKKGRKTLEEANMELIRIPKAPKEYEILAIPLTNAAIDMLRKSMPEEWSRYLPESSSEP